MADKSKDENQEELKFRTDAASKTDSALKVNYALGSIFAYFALAFAGGYCTTNFIVAAGYFIIYEMWIMLWVKILVTSPNIYSIRVPTAFIEGWVPMSIPHDVLSVKKDRPVTSISELSGIRGTYMMIAFRSVTATTGVLMGVAVTLDLNARDAKFLSIKSPEDWAPVLMLGSAIGNMLFGLFDLNMMDKLHTKLHYVGVLLGTICCVMFGFATNWSVLSKILLSALYPTIAYWIYLMISVPKRSRNPATVTAISKKCIAVEVIVFQLSILVCTMTIYASGANQGNYLASIFK